MLARHAEPALSRKCMLTSDQYRDWWARYEIGGILPGQVPPGHLKDAALQAGVVMASTRQRSLETARELVGSRDISQDAVFVEAPLPPPKLPKFVRLTPRAWGVVSRITWWLGHHQGEESRLEAAARSAAAARLLDEAASRGQTVLLVAHGYFNTMIGMQLRRRGWRCVKGRGWRYWSTRYYQRP